MINSDLVSNPLSALQDIHMPPPIGWWPPAPGWYALAFLLFFVIGLSLIFWRKCRLHWRLKRRALQCLAIYHSYYKQGRVQESAALVSQLLKRLALVYFPRQRVAGLKGDEWVYFLNQTAKGVDFNNVYTTLLEVPYQSASTADLSLLFKLAKKWIQQRRRPCLN